MTVLASTAPSATTDATQTSTSLSRAKLSDNFDTFLTLLTAQLANQDPLNPVDSAQFTQQLVQYSQVEQQIGTNEKLASLLTQSQAAGSASAVSFIGKTAVFTNDVTLLSDGSAKWTYDTTGATSDVKISVRDASGKEVYSETRALKTGDQSFEWNGKDSSGRTMTDGPYRLVVTATDGDNKAVTPTIKVEETITGIDFATSGAATVLTGTGVRTFDSIHSVRN